ncbi:uncharacterized protein FTOL_09133 [Fusarium torulosum]|uniref:Probable beta-glucosidase G n=1 Tax=Fusarium torulosum TaxID=33205 RepID=A0AAE8MDZ3_9HYPO|nr:uncharacterized protein FTOL_09133 [Fusarium torulosum]
MSPSVSGFIGLDPKAPKSQYIPKVQDWDKAAAKAGELVAKLNITEKTDTVTGSLSDGSGTGYVGRIRPVERVGFHGICLLDGPNAVNRADLVSIFPSGLSAAASWDRQALLERGIALAEEFKAKGGHVILGHILIFFESQPTLDELGNLFLIARGADTEKVPPLVPLDVTPLELGFRGYVVSDWFATHSTSVAANADFDVEQPGDLPPGVTVSHSGGGYHGSRLVEAVQAGNITEERIDEMVTNLLTPGSKHAFLLTLSNSGWTSKFLQGLGPSIAGRDVLGDHHKLIRKHGASASVLLKNKNEFLPLALAKSRNIGVFGNAATDPTEGLFYTETSDPLYRPEHGPITAIRSHASKTNAMVQHLASHDLISKNDFRSIYPVPDVCVVFLKSWAAETHDRLSFELDWNSTAVVKNVANFCGANKTVVVTNSALVNTLPWANNDNVTAILATQFPGQEIGNSIIDVLCGQIEPSGRLPYTIPKNEEDYDFPVVNITELIRVLTKVKKTETRKGSTVVQLYLEDAPVRVLRGFEKVELSSKKSKKIEFALKRRDVRYWDVAAQQGRIPKGEFKLSIGLVLETFSRRQRPMSLDSLTILCSI